MLEYRNCRDVSQPLSQDHVVRVERTSFYPKEVECADDAPAKRMGRQYTELKPSSTARTLKRGHCSTASLRVRSMIDSPN